MNSSRRYVTLIIALRMASALVSVVEDLLPLVSDIHDSHPQVNIHKQNTNANSNFRESNAVFEMCRTSVRRTNRRVYICLVSCRIPYMSMVWWVGGASMDYDLQRQVNRNRTRKAFASLNPLSPCVTKLSFAVISAIVEPSTTASTAAAFAGFHHRTALATPASDKYRGWSHHCGHFCENVIVSMALETQASMPTDSSH